MLFLIKITAMNPADKIGRDGYSPLSAAIFSGQPRKVVQMIKSGANPNLVTVGHTPLLHAANLQVKQAKPIMEALIAAGADLEARNSIGSTALIIAIKNGRIQTAKLLLQKGADVKAKDKAGKTAADYAPTPEFKKFLENWKPGSTVEIAEKAPSMPKRLADFYKNREGDAYKGFFIQGLPHYTRDTKLKVSFVKGLGLFTENDINPETHPEWMPLCRLSGGESQFLAVKITNPKCPVFMWEHEDAKFYPVAPSLDLFLKKLSAGRQRTKFEPTL